MVMAEVVPKQKYESVVCGKMVKGTTSYNARQNFFFFRYDSFFVFHKRKIVTLQPQTPSCYNAFSREQKDSMMESKQREK